MFLGGGGENGGLRPMSAPYAEFSYGISTSEDQQVDVRGKRVCVGLMRAACPTGSDRSGDGPRKKRPRGRNRWLTLPQRRAYIANLRAKGPRGARGGANRHQSKSIVESNDCQRYSGLAMSRQIESWSDIVKVIHCQGK